MLQEEVLDLCGHSRGISASIFQAPEKLHLTLGTLVIMDAEERERAAQCLTLCKESIVQYVMLCLPCSYIVMLKGLEVLSWLCLQATAAW